MPVDHTSVGVWSAPRTFAVTAESIAGYAGAVGAAGTATPPLYPVVASWTALEACVGAALSPDLLGAIVHRHQDMRFIRPTRAGEELSSRARLTAVVGGSRTTTLVVDVQVASVASFTATILLAGHGGEPSTGDAHPPERLRPSGSPIATIERTVDVDQALRYAEASGDHNSIHLDDEAARAAGFDGVILHGMCTLAVACDCVVERLASGDPARIRRFAGRFSKPVRPGQTLTTTIWPLEGPVFAFECSTADGVVVVVRDGLAEVS